MKPLPCAYCRAEAYVSEVTGNGTKLYKCSAVACEPGRNFIPLTFNGWNFLQEQLLELRRKDFEAGQESMDAYWDGSLSMIKSKTFDQYIAEGKGDE